MYEENVPIDATTTSYGCAAVDLLAAQVTERKKGDRLAQVTVVVPSNYVAVAARRALAASSGGIANVTFVTLRRRAERLGAPALAAVGRRPVSAPTRAGITVPDADTIEPPCATRILSASDPDDEVRAAVRLVTQWTPEGMRLGRIAVV